MEMQKKTKKFTQNAELPVSTTTAFGSAPGAVPNVILVCTLSFSPYGNSTGKYRKLVGLEDWRGMMDAPAIESKVAVTSVRAAILRVLALELHLKQKRM